ncbi:NOL1/NOP2/sun family putative RNA methylase [Aliikangiella sp. IMCC44653]
MSTPAVKIAPEFIQHARSSFLNESELCAFIKACQTPLRTSVRVNTLKMSIQDFSRFAESQAWQLTPIPWCQQGFWLSSDNPENLANLGNSLAHLQGLFYIQEASSMLPPIALCSELTLDSTVHSEPFVLDMAAAPGSKTTQIAAQLNNQGLIVANELSASRLKSLNANLVRCGVSNTILTHLDGRKLGQWLPNQFDFVLLDAPCGGEGTVRKDIKALAQWELAKVKEIAKLQYQMLESAYQALKPGGKLVYSTCTLSKEENHDVVNQLVADSDAEIFHLGSLFPGAERVVSEEGYLHVLPHCFDSEGFFVASVTKPPQAKIFASPVAQYDTPFSAVNKKIMQQARQYFEQHFGFELASMNMDFAQRDKELWCFPKRLGELNRFIKVNRAGMPVAQIFPNKIRASHQWAQCFGDRAQYQSVELTSQQASDFIQGKNLSINSLTLNNGEVILKAQGRVIGLGLNQKGKIKNALPRDLVKDNLNFSF